MGWRAEEEKKVSDLELSPIPSFDKVIFAEQIALGIRVEL
jgi:hypothetical protein